MTVAIEPVWRQAVAAPSQPVPRRADVAIVGGGISGVALLAWLRRAGVDAVLLERDRLAAGASGRNAGFLLTGVAENYARAVERYGRAVAREVWTFTAENHDLALELAQDRETSHRRTGSWTLAETREEAQSLEHAATLLAEDGLTARLVPAAQLPAELRAGHHAGLLLADDGEIDPVRLVLAVAAPHRDRIHEGVRVTALDEAGDGVTLHHTDGELAAGHVAVCTNAWIAELLPTIPVRPVRAQMCATVPQQDVVLDRPSYAGWGFRYWRMLGDTRVLMGGCRDTAVDDEMTSDPTPSERVQRDLDARLRALGVTAPIERRWAGIMGFSPDGVPLVGPPPGTRGISVLAGHTGHGMAFAVHCARVLANALTDRGTIPGWLDPARLRAGSPISRS